MADDTKSEGSFQANLIQLHCLLSEDGGKKYDVLRKLTEHLKEDDLRNLMTQDAFVDVKRILVDCQSVLDNGDGGSHGDRGTTHSMQVCSECFRVLRNSCVKCKKNQDFISLVDILPVVKQLLLQLATKGSPSEDDTVAIRCGVQFLGNFVSSNQSSQSSVWQQCFPEVFLSVLRLEDFKASTYTCMVIYNSLDDCHIQQLIKHPAGQPLVECILKMCQKESEQEWGLYIMEELLLRQEFILTQFETLSSKCQCILLDIMSAKLDSPSGHWEGLPPGSQSSGSTQLIPAFNIAFLAEIFEQQAQKLLLSALDGDMHKTGIEESVTVLHLLQVLCVATSTPGRYDILQARTSLLEITLDLLQKAHAVGKSGDNVFTVRQSLSDEASRNDVAESPVHGFKRDLIRLIGNMCNHHKRNQDLVRQLEGIGLLLEHCSVDEHNPFINQWAVFAIHNLCENNAENQAVIAGMQQRGVVDSQVLKDMGLTVEERDGRPYIKTTRKGK